MNYIEFTQATMMKVSDPIMFGHMVRVFYADVFTKYSDLFKNLGVNPNNGLGDVYDKIKGHPQQAEVEAAIMDCYKSRPGLAMVDSSKGQELHVVNSMNETFVQESRTSTCLVTSS